MRGGLLLWSVNDDRGAVLDTDDRPLAFEARWVIILSEYLEKLLVEDPGRGSYSTDVNHLGVPGLARASTPLYVNFTHQMW
jgi:hypothetical protein